MKKLWIFGILLFGFLDVAYAVQEPIKMVTYFPAPYTAYSQITWRRIAILNITGPNDYYLTLGHAGLNDAPPLDVYHFDLQKPNYSSIPTSLELRGLNSKSDVTADSATIGPSSLLYNNGLTSHENRSTDRRVLFEKDLTVSAQGNNGTDSEIIHTINSPDVTVNGLYMFGKEFPSCKDAFTGSSGKVAWNNLTIDLGSTGAGPQTLSGTFLTCGGTPETCSCPNTYHWKEFMGNAWDCMGCPDYQNGEYLSGPCTQGTPDSAYEECSSSACYNSTFSCVPCTGSECWQCKNESGTAYACSHGGTQCSCPNCWRHNINTGGGTGQTAFYCNGGANSYPLCNDLYNQWNSTQCTGPSDSNSGTRCCIQYSNDGTQTSQWFKTYSYTCVACDSTSQLCQDSYNKGWCGGGGGGGGGNGGDTPGTGTITPGHEQADD